MSTRAEPGHEPNTVSELGERGLIERIRSRFPSPPDVLIVGIGDDAAVAPPVRGELQVLTTDALVEGVHFETAFSGFADVGYKALAVNVSDIAAMGATPRLALLSLILPDLLAVSDLEALLDGFGEMAAAAKTVVAGGNITRSPGPLVVDVTVVGSVRPRRILTRSGGRAGDALFVTGSVGSAGAGLGWLRAHARSAGAQPEEGGIAECVRRHRRPEPRLRLGAVAGRTRAATACMDLSDGLADAVAQLAGQSGTGAVIDAAALPVPAAAARWYESQGMDPVRASMAAGDDYELLFAIPTQGRGRFRNLLRHAGGVPVTRIGELTTDRRLVLRRGDRDEPFPEGFAHFQKK